MVLLLLHHNPVNRRGATPAMAKNTHVCKEEENTNVHLYRYRANTRCVPFHAATCCRRRTLPLYKHVNTYKTALPHMAAFHGHLPSMPASSLTHTAGTFSALHSSPSLPGTPPLLERHDGHGRLPFSFFLPAWAWAEVGRRSGRDSLGPFWFKTRRSTLPTHASSALSKRKDGAPCAARALRFIRPPLGGGPAGGRP